MPTSKNNLETIILGSGKLFFEEFTGEIPSDEEIEKDEKLLGLVSGGASIDYKGTPYTAKDDFGRVTKTILTEEEAILKSGVCTWNGNTIATMCSTARVTETTAKRTVKIGGIGNDNGKKYVLRFLHEDKADGDIRVTIVGKNQAGLSIAFAKDKESILPAEFKAEPCDDEGTLIIYEEEIKYGTTGV